MSETVHYIGKLKKVNRDPEIFADEILEKRGIKKDPYYETRLKQLTGEFYEEYIYHNKTSTLYQVLVNSRHDHNDLALARKVGGKIEYNLIYYNGGAGFSEVLEEALDNMNNG